MSNLSNLLGLRRRLIFHTAADFLGGSKLRIGVTVALAIIFWGLMFAMFLETFLFLNKFKTLKPILTHYLFAVFFMALLVMMTISNAIISYASLFKNDETDFLLSLPLDAGSAFGYKSAESLVFSSWGMMTLVVPLILAYGLTTPVSWLFYVLSPLLAALFVVLPTEIGAAAALAVSLLVPRRRKAFLAALCATGVLLGVLWLVPLMRTRQQGLFTEATIKLVIDRIAFSQHWALPSRWVSEGMLAAGRGATGEATFLLLLLVSNVMFGGLALHHAGRRLYRKAWSLARGISSGRRYAPQGRLCRLWRRLFFFLPDRLYLLLLKDIKTFRRDPAQWSQCLLFFGLLALYTVNIPRFGFAAGGPYWHSLVSQLNLGATVLTLATFTTRFIFPQLSLEGRRIWVIGLLPMRRSTILWGKFMFATAGSVAISGTLIWMSDVVLGLTGWTMVIHAVVIVAICCGLNGLAVGLGAAFPHMRSDSPSRIVSSFGGTLNLVCSICYIMVSLVIVAVPLHLHAMAKLSGMNFVLVIGAVLAAEIALSATVCALPLIAGMRVFNRMEF